MFPWDFPFHTQITLERDERPHPGTFSAEDADLINANRIPINSYPEGFLCRVGISRNFFGAPDEIPIFIGDDGRGGCSFLLLLPLVA